MVNDYLQPPKVTRKMEIGLARFGEIREDLTALVARDPHELMRAMEVHSILDCAEMATRASLFRTESRWGLYHHRVDYPETDNADWFCHTLLEKQSDGTTVSRKLPIAPYIVAVPEAERSSYDNMRLKGAVAAE
jgi:succinate dehydrogenase/fumarate reductase flavoprotein subunit